ncbi:MAG TPA: hypothetical protein VF342_01125 [Alphaproteobacteria bacterium]
MAARPAHSGRSRVWLIGMVSLLGLAACETLSLPPPLASGAGIAPHQADHVEPGMAAAPVEPAAVQSTSGDEAADPVPPQTAAIAPSLPSRSHAPERLIGLSREHLQDLLGPAAFVRRDGPVQIWRYAAERCFLDVFLYREDTGLRVHHVDARSRDGSRITTAECYGRLLDARGPRTG